MTPNTPLTVNAEWVSRTVKLLCTRTLQQFADEARQDGESLRDLVDRYDIDFAWQVLGSQRLLDATVAELESRMERKPTSQQQAEVVAVLHAVALGLASDQLMSFDNDLAQQLAEMMIELWGAAQKERAPSEAV
ncbi:MAG: hypothetical protein AB7S86_14245 [Hydrogenophaga sp.]|uniref:hypothetical protein n=1 Tax=Hydrogenophaga sp. TaxID=1904254 RepID=UPI003D0B7C0B